MDCIDQRPSPTPCRWVVIVGSAPLGRILTSNTIAVGSINRLVGKPSRLGGSSARPAAADLHATEVAALVQWVRGYAAAAGRPLPKIAIQQDLWKLDVSSRALDILDDQPTAQRTLCQQSHITSLMTHRGRAEHLVTTGSATQPKMRQSP